MGEGVEIKGGAGQFEAAVIGIVLDKIARDEKSAQQGRTERGSELSAWVRALSQERPGHPRAVVTPD